MHDRWFKYTDFAMPRGSCSGMLADAPLTEVWELDPLAHARRCRLSLYLGPLLHALLIGALTAQAILLVNSSAQFGADTHANWVSLLFPDGATDDFGGTPLSFPDDEFFAYRSSLVLDTVESVLNGYFTRLSGADADVLGMVDTSFSVGGNGTYAGLSPPVISFTTLGAAPPLPSTLDSETLPPSAGGTLARERPPRLAATPVRSRSSQRKSKRRRRHSSSSSSSRPDSVDADATAPQARTRLPLGGLASGPETSGLVDLPRSLSRAGDLPGQRTSCVVATLADLAAWEARYAPTPEQWAALVQVGEGALLLLGLGTGLGPPSALPDKSRPPPPPPPPAGHDVPLDLPRRPRLQPRARRVHPRRAAVLSVVRRRALRRRVVSRGRSRVPARPLWGLRAGGAAHVGLLARRPLARHPRPRAGPPGDGARRLRAGVARAGGEGGGRGGMHARE